jgi:dTDP-glucose 4,6-dehydratase
MDRLNYSSLNSYYWNKNHTFHIADICDQHIVDSIFKFEQPDIVIHGAALTSTDESFCNASEFVQTNVLGTQNIINACVNYKVEKLIYISSDGVYGDLMDEFALPWNENDAVNPRTPYAATKLAGELLVKAANQTNGLIYNIARLSSSYGPYQTSEKLIPMIIKRAWNGERIPIYGQGQQIRSWTHVHDVSSALLTILNGADPNQIYNVSSNQEMPNLIVAQKICNILEKGHSDIFFNPKTGHDSRRATDNTKIQKLGWKPTFKFKDGIVSTVEWYVDNKNWTLK